MMKKKELAVNAKGVAANARGVRLQDALDRVDQAVEEKDNTERALAAAREEGMRRGMGKTSEEIREKLSRLDYTLAGMKKKYATTQEDVQALKVRASQGTKGVAWSQEVKQVVHAIQKNTRLNSDHVRGPIARYLKLADRPDAAEWSLACEFALGGRILLENTFIVSTNAEATELRRLLRSVLKGKAKWFRVVVYSKERAMRGGVLYEKFGSERLPPRDVVTAQSIIHCSDPWVQNYITNNSNPHASALFKNVRVCDVCMSSLCCSLCCFLSPS